MFLKHDQQNQSLIEKKSDVNKFEIFQKILTFLILISNKKFKLTLDFLVEKNVDINSQDEIGYSILHHAAAKNNFGAIYFILQKPGVNINVSGF